DATVTGVQTCALPIYSRPRGDGEREDGRSADVRGEIGSDHLEGVHAVGLRRIRNRRSARREGVHTSRERALEGHRSLVRREAERRSVHGGDGWRRRREGHHGWYRVNRERERGRKAGVQAGVEGHHRKGKGASEL